MASALATRPSPTSSSSREGSIIDDLGCAATVAAVAFDQRIKGFVAGAFVGVLGSAAAYWFFFRKGGKR